MSAESKLKPPRDTAPAPETTPATDATGTEQAQAAPEQTPPQAPVTTVAAPAKPLPAAEVVAMPKASPLAIMGAKFTIEPAKLLEVLRGTVIKPAKGRDGAPDRVATNEEVAAFVVVANQYGLNPFTREIHAFSDPQKGVIPIVGIDGWVTLVNREPKFDGVSFRDEVNATGELASVTCSMRVKGRDNPVEVTEHMTECKRGTIPWNTMPRRMLRHKAYIQAARYAFGLSGLYDEDEARDVVANATPVQAQISAPRPLLRETPAAAAGK